MTFSSAVLRNVEPNAYTGASEVTPNSSTDVYKTPADRTPVKIQKPKDKTPIMRQITTESNSLNFMLAEVKEAGIDFDKEWLKFDIDHGGTLDIKEAVYFLDEVKRLIQN